MIQRLLDNLFSKEWLNRGILLPTIAFLLLFSFAFHATNPNHAHPYDDHEHATENTEHAQVEFHVASLIHAEDKKWWIQWLLIQQSFSLPDYTVPDFDDVWRQSAQVSINYDIAQLGLDITDPITFYIGKGIIEYRDYA